MSQGSPPRALVEQSHAITVTGIISKATYGSCRPGIQFALVLFLILVSP